MTQLSAAGNVAMEMLSLPTASGPVGVAALASPDFMIEAEAVATVQAR